jgi:hypothetical protein
VSASSPWLVDALNYPGEDEWPSSGAYVQPWDWRKPYAALPTSGHARLIWSTTLVHDVGPRRWSAVRLQSPCLRNV